TIETPDQIATQVLNVLFFDLPIAEIGSFRERVLAVTPDDIQRVARQYVKTDRLSIVLVGNARAFGSQLVEMGFGGYEVIPVDQLDLMSQNLKRATPAPRRGSFEPFGSFESFGSFSFSPRLAYSETQANSRPAATQNVPNAPND